MFMKTIVTFLISLLFFNYSFCQFTDTEELKEEFEDFKPLRWQIYQNDGMIILNPYMLSEYPIQFLELVFQIENNFGYDDFWDDIETLKYLRVVIENELGIQCKKCNTYDELYDFIVKEKKVFTSQLSWKDPKNLYKGIKYTKKSDRLEKALLSYNKAELFKANEFKTKKRRLFQKWLLKNHERIRIFSYDVIDSYYADRKKESVSKYVLDYYSKKSLPFFNDAYNTRYSRQKVLEATTKLAKEFGVYKGPSVDPKTDQIDEILRSYLRTTLFTEYYRKSCELDGATIGEDIVFSPELIINTLLPEKQLWWSRNTHFLRGYRNLILSGAQHVKPKEEIIRIEVESAKKVKYMLGSEHQRKWGMNNRTIGHEKYTNNILRGIQGTFAKYHSNGFPKQFFKYNVSGGLDDKDIISADEFVKKYFQKKPLMRGVRCDKSDKYFHGPTFIYNYDKHKTSYTDGYKYFYDEDMKLSKVEYYERIDFIKPVSLRNFEKELKKRISKPKIIAEFKNNMLNGKVVINDVFDRTLAGTIEETIVDVIVPGLKIKGENALRYMVDNSPYEIYKAELSFSNNLLHGPSKFYYRDIRDGDNSSITVQFVHGLSEIDLKKIKN